jgi:hypothetical protein
MLGLNFIVKDWSADAWKRLLRQIGHAARGFRERTKIIPMQCSTYDEVLLLIFVNPNDRTRYVSDDFNITQPLLMAYSQSFMDQIDEKKNDQAKPGNNFSNSPDNASKIPELLSNAPDGGIKPSSRHGGCWFSSICDQPPGNLVVTGYTSSCFTTCI